MAQLLKNTPKRNLTLTKILVFGTFDFIHKGHLDFFKQARKLAKNSFLIVSVARTANVKSIKGFTPALSERRRREELKKIKIVDQVVMGDKTDYIKHIKKLNPDIIALGYDQTAYTESLKSDLKKVKINSKIHRMRPFKPHVYKSSLLKQKYGII